MTHYFIVKVETDIDDRPSLWRDFIERAIMDAINADGTPREQSDDEVIAIEVDYATEDQWRDQ